METKQRLLQGSWIFGAAFLVLLTTLHFLEPEFDPTWRLISEYEIGNFGWLMQIAFFCWGIGFLLLTFSLWSFMDTKGGKIGKWWLLIISLVVFGAGVFTTQPITDTLRGTADQVHAICGAIMIFTFPIVSTILASSLAKKVILRPYRLKLLLVTLFVWIGFIIFFSSLMIYKDQVQIKAYSAVVLIGIPNRIMVLTYATWLITCSRLLIRAIKKKDIAIR